MLVSYVKRSVSGSIMRIALCIFILTAVAGCNSGGGPAPSTNAAPPLPPSNNAPTISGSPPQQVTEGQTYSFTPVASDADGDTLVFSIENLPLWASFDTGTGGIIGTPDATDIGKTLGIVISVSDGTDAASLEPFDIEVLQLRLGSATVSWSIPTKNADGSALEDLAGFDVYYGRESGNYSGTVIINDEAATDILIEDLEPGTWYFSVSAFDLAGNRSGKSVEVSKDVSP